MDNWALPPRLEKYIYSGEREKALALLGRITALDTGGLFGADDESYLRFAGHFRIQLLLEWGRYREALAWACLECELYPGNPEATLQKERIKRYLRNLPTGHADEGKKPQRAAPAELVADWGRVAGMRELKARLERDVILPFRNPEESLRYSLSVPRGILFYGPPGCGKTEIARQLASILRFHFVFVKPSTLGSTYVHGSQLRIRELFDQAAKNSPSVLFFDEFDALVPERSSGMLSHHYQQEVNEFLTQLDSAHDKKILVIAATNYIGKIDGAVLRPGRMDRKILVGPPDLEARIDAFRMHLGSAPHRVTNWEYLGEETQHYSYADIKLIVDEAKRKAKDLSLPVDLNHLMMAVKETPPSLTEKVLRQYIQ